MRLIIGLILCAAVILSWLSMPSFAGSWIVQSISQGATGDGNSNGILDGVQVAGASNDDVFIVQHIVQEARANDPDIGDIRDIAIINSGNQLVAQSNIPEDLNKVVEEIKNKDYSFGVPFCEMDFPLISEKIDKPAEGPNDPGVPIDPEGSDELKSIDDANFYEYIILLMDGKWDFGDAPDKYHTLLASNGAKHFIVPGVYLGQKIDAEADGQPNINATGDDLNGTDDEDGVVFASALNPGKNALIDVTASCPGFLNAWIDSNGDGDWTDVGERIFSDQRLDSGINHINFTVPAGALEGSTYARFRFSSVRGLSFEGPAPDGEVEDYRVQIVKP
jgi:hypothetical protein